MGLDMYLNRYPRYKNYKPEDINMVESLYGYANDKEAREKYSLEEWCGVDESKIPPQEDVKHLLQFMSVKYWGWDTEHKYPQNMIHEQVAYWRKANAIHKWFVDNIQDGKDDCCYHRAVTKRDLEKLINICKEILDNVVLEDGKIVNGYRWTKERGEEPIYEDGKYIANTEVCERLLPSEAGFFFGSMDYDQYYIRDIKYTYKVLNRVLKETNFETQMLFYVSLW